MNDTWQRLRLLTLTCRKMGITGYLSWVAMYQAPQESEWGMRTVTRTVLLSNWASPQREATPASSKWALVGNFDFD